MDKLFATLIKECQDKSFTEEKIVSDNMKECIEKSCEEKTTKENCNELFNTKFEKCLCLRTVQSGEKCSLCLKALEEYIPPERSFLAQYVNCRTNLGFCDQLTPEEEKDITFLDLEHNNIISLPDGIGNLKELQKLWLDHNNLTSLPDSIGNLNELKELWLHNNNLISLPDSIGNLKELKELWLDNNQLTSLPDSIGDLKELKRLGLENNQLTSLPESMKNLQNLKYINLNGNPIKLDFYYSIENFFKALEKLSKEKMT